VTAASLSTEDDDDGADFAEKNRVNFVVLVLLCFDLTALAFYSLSDFHFSDLKTL